MRIQDGPGQNEIDAERIGYALGTLIGKGVKAAVLLVGALLLAGLLWGVYALVAGLVSWIGA